MNTPVTFELAKLLKEKSFEERAKSYNQDGKLVTVSMTIRRLKLDKIYYPAPTIAEVVMWLYEKHGFWIEVSKLDGYQNLFFYTITGSNGFNFGAKISVIEWDDDKCDEMGYNNKYKNSPTEAYEAAIEYILNNLI